ncbi:MAG: hypothetical protein JWR63_3535, partial [Conexibacter sp.]|nr:hypothetical protein [Conexibacter sp.]
QDRAGAPQPTRTAILAGADAPAGAVATATSQSATPIDVRRASGPLDTQAQATRLAAEGYDTVIGIGAQARAAVSQAASAEVGSDTTWRTAAH